jgi:hypothetical protein
MVTWQCQWTKLNRFSVSILTPHLSWYVVENMINIYAYTILVLFCDLSIYIYTVLKNYTYIIILIFMWFHRLCSRSSAHHKHYVTSHGWASCWAEDQRCNPPHQNPCHPAPCTEIIWESPIRCCADDGSLTCLNFVAKPVTKKTAGSTMCVVKTCLVMKTTKRQT